MVRGIESFRKWFSDCEEQYAIIGGTACDLLMSEEGLSFRATKDIDLVLIVEAMDAEFGKRLWDYVVSAGYSHRHKSTGETQFYRFSDPQSRDYPYMIELFSRKPDGIRLPEGAVLSPLPVDGDISSLSAILINEDYYEFLRMGRITASGITFLSAPYLIPFKAKAWMELSDRKAEGSQVDSRDIRKHKNDVFRLTELLRQNEMPLSGVPETVRSDMREFIRRVSLESIDLEQLGVYNRDLNTILEELKRIYE